MIDFSDIDEIRRTVEYCNRIDVHARHPYVGDLVHTAFSGTHQDAIKKGFAEHRDRAASEGRAESEIVWRVPYLPIDPADIGRSYDAVIRVNSQSGKGGIAYLLETEYGIELPRRMQIDLARHVQAHTDTTGTEVTAAELWSIFEHAYLHPTRGGDARVQLVGYETGEHDGISRTRIEASMDGTEITTVHEGIGPVEALTKTLSGRGIEVEVLELHQTSIGAGNDSQALTLIEYRHPDGTSWAGGRADSVLAASMNAVMTAANTVQVATADSAAVTAVPSVR